MLKINELTIEDWQKLYPELDDSKTTKKNYNVAKNVINAREQKNKYEDKRYLFRHYEGVLKQLERNFPEIYYTVIKPNPSTRSLEKKRQEKYQKNQFQK